MSRSRQTAVAGFSVRARPGGVTLLYRIARSHPAWIACLSGPTRPDPLQIVLIRACLYGRGGCADFTLKSAALIKTNPAKWWVAAHCRPQPFQSCAGADCVVPVGGGGKPVDETMKWKAVARYNPLAGSGEIPTRVVPTASSAIPIAACWHHSGWNHCLSNLDGVRCFYCDVQSSCADTTLIVISRGPRGRDARG